MALSDKKVLASAEHYRNVQAQQGTRLTGTVAENKKVFDDYPELIKDQYNGLIDYLMSTTADASGASQIGVETIAGLIGTDIQTLLEALKTLVDTKADTTTVASTYETITNANALISNVTYNADNGTFTFTKQGGTTIAIDTTIEQIPVTMKFFENPVGSGTYYLGIYDKDDTLISSVNVSALFNPITVADTNTIDLTETTAATGVKTITASVKAGSIGSTEINPQYMQDINDAVDAAETAETNAETAATNAENYKTQAGTSATNAAASELGASGYATNASNSATTAQNKATEASGYANNASGSATNASGHAITAKSWAVGETGTRSGEDTNNAKYWCERAQIIVGGVYVTNVNNIAPAGGVSGGITIDTDDLSDTDCTNKFVTSAEKIVWNAKQDAIPANTYDAYGSANTVQENLNTHTADTTVHVTSSDKTSWNNKQNLILTSSEMATAGFHNSIFRGKDITSYYQDGTLWKRINGTDGYSLFEDLYIGDYFKMSRPISAYEQTQQYQATGSQYVTIADFDGMMGNGSASAVNYHHIVCVPGQGAGGTQHFGRSRMNATNVTTGGYQGSEMFTTTLGAVTSSGSTATTATINEQLYAEFGSHLKTTNELLSNATNATGYNRFGTNGGCSNNWSWVNVQAVLMSEVEVYGSVVWSSSGYDTGTANRQLALFRLSKNAINNRSAYYWLKDVASSAYFCRSDDFGDAYYLVAGDATGYVRPRFLLS